MDIWLDILQVGLALGTGWVSLVLIRLSRPTKQPSATVMVHNRHTNASAVDSASPLSIGQLSGRKR